MYSFYGGIQGQSFSFSAIFSSKAALELDITANSFSAIQLNEFVFINYGSQLIKNDKEEKSIYEINKEIDKEAYGQTYNATVWQKIYRSNLKNLDNSNTNSYIYVYNNDKYYITDIVPQEKTNNDNGYCYICIGYLQGTTPIFSVNEPVSLAPADKPTVNIDNTDIEKPSITFGIPEAAQFFTQRELEINFPNSLTFEKEDDENKSARLIFGSLSSEDKIKFLKLIKLGDYFISNVGEIYLITVNFNNTYYILKPQLFYFIPNQELMSVKNIATFDTDSNINQPTVSRIEATDNSGRWGLEFGIPQTPQFLIGSVESAMTPNVNLEKDIKNSTIKLNFDLPKGDKGDQGLKGDPLVITKKYSLVKVYSSNAGNTPEEKILNVINNGNYGNLGNEFLPILYEDKNSYFAYIGKDNEFEVMPLLGGSVDIDLKWEELE